MSEFSYHYLHDIHGIINKLRISYTPIIQYSIHYTLIFLMMLSDEVMSSTSWQVRGTSRVLAMRDSDRVILTKKELLETGKLCCWIKS